MANTQKANPADRFRTPASVAKWHLTRRLQRGRGYRPDNGDTAENLPQAFRLDLSKPGAGEKAKTTKA
jgi:hypothetical protein